jgi:glycosyltransferase involved in cell wall biosynthesis
VTTTPSPGTAAQLLGPSTGGIRNHVTTLAAGLTRLGWAAPVLGPDGVLDGIGVLDGVVPVPPGMSPTGLRSARQAVRPWRAEASLLHAHGLKAAWTLVAGRPARPVVMTQHNIVLDQSAGRSAELQKRLEREVLKRVDRVIAPTPQLAAALAGTVPEDRIRVVVPCFPRPVPTASRAEVRHRLGLSDDTPVVVAVTRLHPQKDLTTLVAAWAQVVDSVPDAQLVVVGEGPARPEVESAVAAAGLTASVQLIGSRPRAADELAAADVAVLTSVWEAIPIVLAEALLLGVPVVSTDVGMASDLMGDGTGGRVVPVGDADAVAGGLVALLEDPDRAQVGLAGQARAEHVFDPDALVAGVAKVYEELV